MKIKINRKISATSFVLTILLLLSSCSNEPTLQSYFVDNQEQPNFLSVDIPMSMVDYSQSNLSEKEVEATKTISKIAFLGFKKTNENQEVYTKEVSKIQAILKNSKYSALGEFNKYGTKLLVNAVGNAEQPKELIIFAKKPEQGFAVIRVLGEDLNLGKLFAFAETLPKATIDEQQLESISNFFSK